MRHALVRGIEVHRDVKPSNCLTAAYMAPEQFSDPRHVDTRADIYSFGVMLFEMATGKKPFMAANWTDYKRQHQTKGPPLETVNKTVCER